MKPLNETINPKNNKLFYYATLKEFISIVVYLYRFMGDQLGKKFYNHAGGNSKHGRVLRVSYNVRGTCQNLVSHDECDKLLTIGEDSNRCSNCSN